MRLNSIVLKNYRCFGDLTVMFQPGFNVIAGVNGSGKTSVLKGVREALGGYTSYVQTLGVGLAPLTEPNAARVQSNVSAGRYRFEEKYPVAVSATGEAFGQTIGWAVVKVDQAGPVTWEGAIPGQLWQSMQSVQMPLAVEGLYATPISLPIIAFYPAYRNWLPAKPNEMTAATESPSRTDGYHLWWEAASDSTALQQWAISKSQERLQLSSDRAVKCNSATASDAVTPRVSSRTSDMS